MPVWEPKNKKLIVKKKLGVGWTLNFGNPLAWLLITVILLLIILILYL